MGVILNWVSAYPATVDDTVANFPPVADGVNDVMSSHVNALATSLIAVEVENIVHKKNTSTITGCNNEFDNTLTVERVVGGLVLDGSSLGTLAVKFRMLGVFVNGAASGNARLRLYDMGPVAGPPVAGVLRSDVSIGHAIGGGPRLVENTLTALAAPVNPNEIFDTARIYELRLYLDSVTVGDTMTVYWGGIVLE